MDDPILVEVDQSFDCLLDVAGTFAFAEKLFLAESVEKRPRTQLYHQIQVIAFFVAFI